MTITNLEHEDFLIKIRLMLASAVANELFLLIITAILMIDRLINLMLTLIEIELE